MHRGERGDGKIAGVDVAIDEFQLVLHALEDLIERPPGFRRPSLELEISDEPSQPQHRR
jgi:hypothetical protein